MPDIATISSILGSVKTATEIAKLLKDSNLSLEQAETKLKLAELISSLADAKLEIAEIKEIILEKDKKINELQEAQQLSKKMMWRDAVYFQENEHGEEGPFCPQCYDNSKKVIRLQTYEAGHWHCMTCDKSFFGKSYNPRRSIAADTDFDPFA